MKMVSWNVNGLRACVGKNFMEFFNEVDADIFSLQETKLQAGQIDLDFPNYYQYWDYSEKKRYLSVAVFTKKKTIFVTYGIKGEKKNKKGRDINL